MFTDVFVLLYVYQYYTCMYASAPCLCKDLGYQQWISYPMELKLQTFVNQYGGSEYQTQVLGKNSRCL